MNMLYSICPTRYGSGKLCDTFKVFHSPNEGLHTEKKSLVSVPVFESGSIVHTFGGMT